MKKLYIIVLSLFFVNFNSLFGQILRRFIPNEEMRMQIEEKLSELLTILKTDTVNLSTLDLFWEKEEKTEYTPLHFLF